MKIPFWNLKIIVPFVFSMDCFNPSRYFLSEVHMFTFHVTNAIAMSALFIVTTRKTQGHIPWNVIFINILLFCSLKLCGGLHHTMNKEEGVVFRISSFINWNKTLSLPLSSFHIHHFRTLKKAAVQQCWIFRCDSFTRFGVWEGGSLHKWRL